MEEVKSKVKDLEELLSYDVSDFSEKEREMMIEAIFEYRPDLDDLDDILIVQRDREFKNFAIIILFHREVIIKCKGAGIEKYYDHKLGMHKERDRETDWEASVPKKNLTSISVTRADVCVCENCMANRDVMEGVEQPDIYEIDFYTGDKSYTVQLPEREMAFQYKEWIAQWLMEGHKNNKHKKKH